MKSLNDGSEVLVPGRTRWERVVKSNLRNVNDSSGGAARGNCDDGLKDVSEVTSDVLRAVLFGFEAKSSTTVYEAFGAVTPADGANTIGVVLARWVAETSIVLLLGVAGQRGASGATVGVFGARDTDISHTGGTVWRADAAGHVVEVLTALRVPQETPLFAVIALVS